MQFSLLTLMLLVTGCGLLLGVARIISLAAALALVLFLAMIALPIAGAVYIAGNFQTTGDLRSWPRRFSFAVTGLISLIAVWLISAAVGALWARLANWL